MTTRVTLTASNFSAGDTDLPKLRFALTNQDGSGVDGFPAVDVTSAVLATFDGVPDGAYFGIVQGIGLDGSLVGSQVSTDLITVTTTATPTPTPAPVYKVPGSLTAEVTQI